MTVRQYWVHHDEPLTATTSLVVLTPPPAPTNWEPVFQSLLNLLEPHAGLYHAALDLLANALHQRQRPKPPG